MSCKRGIISIHRPNRIDAVKGVPMIENGCCFLHFGVWRKLAHLVGIWVGGGGGGGGGADVQRQLDGVVRNKLIYQRIATALRDCVYDRT